MGPKKICPTFYLPITRTTFFECFVPDVGDTVRNDRAGEAALIKKRQRPDVDHRIAIGRSGNDRCAIGAGVAGDGDRAVVGSEGKLGVQEHRHCQ